MQFNGNKRSLKGCKWSSLDVPGTENPLSHSLLGLEEFPFSHYWPSGVIRIGLPVKKLENSKNKRGLKECKWSSLNSSQPKRSMSIQFITHSALEEYGLVRAGVSAGWARSRSVFRSVTPRYPRCTLLLRQLNGSLFDKLTTFQLLG